MLLNVGVSPCHPPTPFPLQNLLWDVVFPPGSAAAIPERSPKTGFFTQRAKTLGFPHFIFQNHIEKIENLDSFPNLRYGSSCSRGFPWIPLAGREGGIKFQPSGHGGLGHLPPPHPPRALQVPLPGWKPHPEGGKPAGSAPPERPGPVPQPDPGAGHRWEKRERLQSAAGVCGMHIPALPASVSLDVGGGNAASGIGSGVREELWESGGIWGGSVPPFIPAEELPRSLQILDLTGNECTRRDGYRWVRRGRRGRRTPQKSGEASG